MKPINKISALAIVLVIAFSSCKKEDNSSSTNNNTSSNISAVITSGTWRVSYFHESGNDHTSNFNGYAFAFTGSGVMTAVNSSGTTTGTWRIDDDGSNEFHMSIGNTTPLTDLNKGWIIISQTATEIDMRDDDSNHNEELHFTKI